MPRLVQALCLGKLISKVSTKRIRVVALKPNKDLEYMNDMFEANGLEVVIDGPYDLSEVPQAVQRFGEAKHVGKVVVTIAPADSEARTR